MIKVKKGFAVALAAGILTTGGVGVQTSAFIATAHAQFDAPPIDEGEDDEEGEGGDDGQDSGTDPGTENGESTPGSQGGQTGSSPGQGGQPTASIPQIPETVALTLHKYDKEHALTTKSDGLTKTVSGTPLAATFSLQKVKDTVVDLHTNAGWKKAADLSKSFDATDPVTSLGGAANLETAISVDANTQKTGLTPGLYLVTETKAPAGYQISVKPFVVALPMTHPTDRTKWLEDVHIYPKDTKESESTKTVEDGAVKGVIAGKNIKYTITQPLSEGNFYNGMQLVDHYDKDRLTYVDVETTAETVVKVGDTTLTKGTHYTVDSTAHDTMVKIVLTKSGLVEVNKVLKKTPEKSVTADLWFTVKKLTTTGAAAPIENKFKTWTSRENTPPKPTDDGSTPPTTVKTPPAGPKDPDNPENPTPRDPKNPPTYPKSYYGNVNIVKHNGENIPMPGVHFNIYECSAAGQIAADANPLNWTDKNNNGTFDADEVVPIITSIDPNNPEIRGLLVNDFRDNSPVAAADQGQYCLVETKTLPGYQLLAEPIPFKLMKGANSDTVVVKSVDIVNSKTGFDLPLTGGKGVFALLLAGAAFLVLGRGYSVYAGRRKDA